MRKLFRYKFVLIWVTLITIITVNAEIMPSLPDQTICKRFELKSDEPMTIQHAVNITIACNRNLQKAFLNRITERYSLDVAEYKFKPNINLDFNANYAKIDRHHDIDHYKSANISPQFNILTPFGSTISLNWQNLATNPNNIRTFRNASRIIIRQPLLKQSGLDYQTASVKNAEDNNNFQILQLADLIKIEINKTIFSFRQIIQNIKQLEIQEKYLHITKKLLTQTNQLINAGRLAEYEKVQVESQVTSQELNLTDAKINLKRSYLSLINQLGLEIDPKISSDLNSDINSKIILKYDQNLIPPKPIVPSDKLLKTALQNNIAYRNILLQEEINKRDYYAAYNQSRWTLDLSVGYQLQSLDNNYNTSFKKYFNSTNRDTTVNLQFNIPIDANPSRTQAIVENKVRSQQIILDKKQLEQEISSELQDNLYQQKILWEKLQLATKSVTIKNDGFNMAKTKYEAGRLSSFELMRIQDDIANAKAIENSNLIAYLNNCTIIDRILDKTFKQWSINVEIQ